ncbi:hypothetical protein G6F61_014993 [Rhizopus arrhizus]|nr:hypothetical protein G6F61_014993 [Rhizopus arrhizus]
MPTRIPASAWTSCTPTNGWTRSPKAWTSRSEAVFQRPATCWAHASGRTTGCCAPARIMCAAWACPANPRT